jgi:aminoglycoside 6'-N-acetyltransferase
MTVAAVPLLPRSCGRIVLRKLRVADLERFQAYRHDPDVGRFQGWSPQGDAVAREFLADMAHCEVLKNGAWTQLAIARDADDALLGDLGIRLSDDGSEAEIGISLARESQGQGFAGDAVRGAFALVFEQTRATHVVGVADARNVACLRLLERAGMRRVASVEAMFRGERCLEHTYRMDRAHSG